MKVFYYFISFICLFNKYNSRIMYFSNLCFKKSKFSEKIFELNFYNKNKFEGITKFESTNNIYLIENLLDIDKNVENYENLIIFFYTNSDFKYLYKINKFNYIIIDKSDIDDLEIISNKFYLFTIEESSELYNYIKNKKKTAKINFFEKNLKNGNKILKYNFYCSIIIFIILFVLIKCIQCRNNFDIYKILKNLNYIHLLSVFFNYIHKFFDKKDYETNYFILYGFYKSYIISMFIFIVLGSNIIFFSNIEQKFKDFCLIFYLFNLSSEVFLMFLYSKEIYYYENLFRNIKRLIEYFFLLIIIFY